MRNVIMLMATLVLAGCFSSRAPLFEEARGRCPFAVPTHFVELGEAGAPPMRVTFSTEGGYCRFTKEDGETERALFVPIGRNWWIVQGDEERPSYLLVLRSGRRLIQYLPRCADFSTRRLDRLGVAYDEAQRYCTADDPRQIETLFRAWRSPFRQASGGFRQVDDVSSAPASSSSTAGMAY